MQSLNNLLNKPFNDLYKERPVWALASTGTATTMQQPVMALFGASNPYTPLSVEYTGSAKSRARSFADESSNANFTFYGQSATGPGATSAWAAISGLMGINSISTQTACLANFECFDSGSYGWYGSVSSGAFDLADRCGTVVGEQNWRQMYDLVLDETGAIYKDVVGGVYNFVTAANRPKINLALSATLGGDYVASAVFGRGQISHNRNTGRLMVAQPVSGVTGTSLTYKIHLFDLQLNISNATTIAEIKAAMVACAVTGSNRYRTFAITLNSAAIHYSAATNYDIAGTKFVLCDDDSIWAFKESHTSTGGTGNVLWALTHTLTWLDGAYTSTAVLTQSASSTYGYSAGAQYGVRFMNSDDNSVIAMYQQNYYYCVGANVAFVSTKKANATDYNYASFASNTNFYSIAPSGGPNFVMTKAGTTTTINHDTQGALIGHLDNTVLAATAHNPTFMGYLYPVMNRSTCYGVADIVLKVQPTSEWK